MPKEMEFLMTERNRIKPDLASTVGQWEYVYCWCIVNLGQSGVFIGRECNACGNTNFRFMHVLENNESRRHIIVGIDCAGVLMGGSEIPVLAENETKRKESWRVHYRRPGRCSTDIDDLIRRGKL
jgi:hypothetical protein